MGDEDMTDEEFDRAFKQGAEVEVGGGGWVVVEDLATLPGATRIVCQWTAAVALAELPVIATPSVSSAPGARQQPQAMNLALSRPQ